MFSTKCSTRSCSSSFGVVVIVRIVTAPASEGVVSNSLKISSRCFWISGVIRGEFVWSTTVTLMDGIQYLPGGKQAVRLIAPVGSEGCSAGGNEIVHLLGRTGAMQIWRTNPPFEGAISHCGSEGVTPKAPLH